MKRDIEDFVSKYPNCQQVKVEHQKPGGMTQEIDLPALKWEVTKYKFHHRVTLYGIQHDSIRVILDRMTKSSPFLAIKTTNLTEDYPNRYINEIVRLYGVPFYIISYRGPQSTSNFRLSF